MEGNASVYRVNPVSRIAGEGRAEFLRTWGPDFDQEGARGETGGAAQFVRVLLLFSHINSHNQVRGHRTGSSHSGAEEYPREKNTQPKVVHAYITADAIHASTRNI